MQEHIKKRVLNVAGLSLLLYLPLLLTMSFGPITGLGPWTASIEVGFIIPVIFMIVGAAGGVLSLFFKKHRSKGVETLLTVLCLAVLFVPVTISASELRSFGFFLTAKRAEPLVAAIKKYHENTGNFPETFDDLIPAYILKVPYGLPHLRIVKDFDGSWAMTAGVGTGFLNWDAFIYKYDQSYGEKSCGGGWCEPMGGWAYLHE